MVSVPTSLNRVPLFTPAVKLPIVGLHKIYYDTVGEIIMTPTIEHAKALYEVVHRLLLWMLHWLQTT